MTEDFTFGKQAKSSGLSIPSPVDSNVSPNVKTSDQGPHLVEVCPEACEQPAPDQSHQSQALVQRNGSGSVRKSKRREKGSEPETNGSGQHPYGQCLPSKNLCVCLCCYPGVFSLKYNRGTRAH